MPQARQPAGWELTHPSADRVPKAILSSQPPLNIYLDMVLLISGTRPSTTHHWAGITSSYWENCIRLRTKLTHQMTKTKCNRSYDPPANRKETTNTNSQRNSENNWCGRGCGKLEPSYAASGTVKWLSHFGKQFGSSPNDET